MGKQKNIIGALITACITLNAAFTVMAGNDITVKLNDEAIEFDVSPKIMNERTMVPLRAIFEALGASVEWNQSAQTVTSKKDDTIIRLVINSDRMYVNDKTVILDSPACIVDERTFVPVRAISEAYGADIEWDGRLRTVSISYMTLSYKDAENRINTYLRDMLGSDMSDVTYEGNKKAVVHDNSRAYEFKCYSKSVQKDGEDGLIGTLYVYADGSIGE